MPTVQIYHQGNIQEEKDFKYRCWLVWNDVAGLTCIIDMKQNTATKTGHLITRVDDASTNPELIAVLPEWEFLIDDVIQPQQFYLSVMGIGGKVIKLRFEDYECILDLTT